MKKIAIVLACVAIVCMISGCANEVQPPKQDVTKELKEAIDLETAREFNLEGQVTNGLPKIAILAGIHDLPEPEQEATEEPAEDEYYEEYYDEYYYEPVYYGSTSYDSSDGFMQQGVREGVDSETETWYSSNQLYHYRTGEWHTDDEGYYRDDDGYYVVASDDYAQGDVINTSKGEARVYDSGAAPGNTDFYVDW